MVSTSRGQAAIYSGGIPQQGGSLLSRAKDASAFAKKHKLVSKGSALASDLGFDKSLNKATKGLYSKGVSAAKTRGYGKKKKVAVRVTRRIKARKM
jgi:hypothetical protein